MNVVVAIGAGSIGRALAHRMGAGKHVMLADLRPENATAAAKKGDKHATNARKMEASPGIEPGCKDLQSSA